MASLSARSSTPTSVITNLEETLAVLDEYQPPPGLTPLSNDQSQSTAKSSKVTSLIERYERLREDMLKNNIEHEILEHAKTHDLTEPTTESDSSTDDGNAEIQQKRNKMVEDLQATADRIVQEEQGLQADYAMLKQRKEELRELLLEFQKKGDEDDTWSMPDGVDTEEDVDDETMDIDLAEQEEVLMNLERKKLLLKAQLQELQDEVAEVDQENLHLDAKLAALEDTETLEKENEELQKQLDQLITIKNDYDYRRMILEELAGIKIESIQEEKVAAKGKGSAPVLLIHVNFTLLHAHNLRVSIEYKPGEEGLITSARFLENPPPPAEAAASQYLHLPPLDDLIPIAQTYPGNLQPTDRSGSGGFRFLVHSALARLECRNEREAELAMLRNTHGCKVKVRQNPSDPEDYLFQQVECHIPWQEGDTVVECILRLTPDCPRVQGSLFLDDLKCAKHVWAIRLLASKFQGEQNRYSSPLQLVSELQQSLTTALQQKEPRSISVAAAGGGIQQDSPLKHDSSADLWEC
mmetsp:Transcript_30038/g.82463  ORF Transcript_30038/g.82463 Transcript_30038/m.82463 type:complete len:523 (+) Transcript_30038:111-1679(+)|eukprot:CAMPEP_0168751412 /NCGR_PEP_ID=MMETSP0724-20121128/17810_1 /TAXON_ID=265536 /ORGANISM="Amphiprora sp., Strain CCMP467" /LENGTH=522 /DNA_ID=CAMNT_0008799535 /DNA_START=36 /DNA_END=1604 /DNA_ORIENTATION=-